MACQFGLTLDSIPTGLYLMGNAWRGHCAAALERGIAAGTKETPESAN
jgi:hypothetical protein